jgi:predicted aspartyl protease
MKISAFVLPVIVALSACQTAPGVVPRPSAVTTIPFEFRKNEIILQATPAGGAPLSFMLDTGVDPSAIDTAVAESLGVSVDASIVGEAAGTGDGQGLDVMPAMLPSLTIGGTDFPPIEALAADLSGFGAALDLKLAGILGHSFLEGRVVRIDYAAQRIDIAGSRADLPVPVTPVSRAYSVPFDFVSEEDPTPVFEVVIKGQPVRVSLDTGSSGGLELFADVTERLELASVAEAGADAQALGARGERSLKRSTLENVQVGPFTLPELDVRFSDHEAVVTEREGNSGNRLFSQFVLTLDYVTHEIVFEQ